MLVSTELLWVQSPQPWTGCEQTKGKECSFGFSRCSWGIEGRMLDEPEECLHRRLVDHLWVTFKAQLIRGCFSFLQRFPPPPPPRPLFLSQHGGEPGSRAEPHCPKETIWRRGLYDCLLYEGWTEKIWWVCRSEKTVFKILRTFEKISLRWRHYVLAVASPSHVTIAGDLVGLYFANL